MIKIIAAIITGLTLASGLIAVYKFFLSQRNIYARKDTWKLIRELEACHKEYKTPKYKFGGPHLQEKIRNRCTKLYFELQKVVEKDLEYNGSLGDVLRERLKVSGVI